MNARTLATAVVVSSLVCVIGTSRSLATCFDGSNVGWFYFDGTPSHGYCRLTIGPDLDTLTVVVDANPFQKARFTVPDPPFGTVVGENWFYSYTGDS
jgi:hypothetical protein